MGSYFCENLSATASFWTWGWTSLMPPTFQCAPSPLIATDRHGLVALHRSAPCLVQAHPAFSWRAVSNCSYNVVTTLDGKPKPLPCGKGKIKPLIKGITANVCAPS